jgi:hypothetical protein
MKKSVLSYQNATKYIIETLRMAEVFTKDMKKIIDNTEKVTFESELQFWFRIAIRTAIDYIDALVYRLGFLSKEIIKLREDEKKIYSKPKEKNLRLFFKELAIAINSKFDVEEDDKFLNNYYDARKIRHRVTHPKKLADLSVLLEEYRKVVDAYEWFDYCLKKISRHRA